MTELFLDHIGINITTSKIQIVQVSFSNNEFILENINEKYFSEFLDFNAEKTRIISLMQNAFDEISSKKNLRNKYYSFTLPQNVFRTVQLPIENTLLDFDLVEHFKWEYSVLFPEVSQDELVLQFIKVGEGNPSAIISGTLKKYIEILKEFCDLYEANIKYVDNAHFASDNLLAYETGIPGNLFVLSLYLSNEYMSLDLLQNNKPVKFTTVPLRHSSEIIQVINKFIKNTRILNNNDKLISRIYIAGDSIPDSLISGIKTEFNFEVCFVNPFNKIKHSSFLTDNKFISPGFNSFSSAAGIAFRLIY
jgi:Tfp pilus assembly PilM family ATPase